MKASINLERFKENIATAFPNARTTRAIRLKSQTKLALKKTEPSEQMGLFDFIETADTLPKSLLIPEKENNVIEKKAIPREKRSDCGEDLE